MSCANKIENYYEVAGNIVPKVYLKQASDAKKTRERRVKDLLEHRKWPQNGWHDTDIEQLVTELSNMDSNNFPGNVGIGEREARIACNLVAKRHYGFGHGIGRSGDLCEPQPKAAGSTLMAGLTNCMLKDVIKTMGVPQVASCILLPVATGMSLVLCMLTIKKSRPNAKYVIWSRIDQKSCFKSIITAGLIPIIIDMLETGDELRTDLETIIKHITDIGECNIVCVMSTISCFAPRGADDILSIASICRSSGIPHIINNAYGLQSNTCMNKIQQASRCGRVDVFVQSTDKNLLVPVGGAIIASFREDILNEISKMYPGRASLSPVLDVFMTLLSLGSIKYLSLVKKRKELYIYLKQEMMNLGKTHDEKVYETKGNPISIAMTLTLIPPSQATMVGSMLFVRGISGARVIQNSPNHVKTICGYVFANWGGHHSTPKTGAYLTAAATLAGSTEEVDVFLKKLDRILTKVKSKDEKLHLNSEVIASDKNVDYSSAKYVDAALRNTLHH